MQAVRNENTVTAIDDNEQVYKSLELNLRIKPEDSYVFDGLTLSETELWLNNATFYSELVYNIQLEKFLKERDLADAFVPVATFNQNKRKQDQEYVAIVEGAHFPFFAIAFSIQRIQFNSHLQIDEDVDHSKAAVRMAQRMGNLFVDEARLSGNTFRLASDEYKAVIENYDAKVLENEDQFSDYEALVNGEMYLFWRVINFSIILI